MLILSRKKGEVVVIPRCQLTITVISVEGDRVRLGIHAPDEMDVYRAGVWRRFCEETDRPPVTGKESHGDLS